MEWSHVYPYGKDSYQYWIAGVYKIVSYDAGRFHAFYIPPDYQNWGEYVSNPPLTDSLGKYWPTLKDAQKSCVEHAKTYEPQPKTIARAAEILAALVKKEKEYS